MAKQRKIPKDGQGEQREQRVKVLRARLVGLKDLRATHEMMPFEKRDVQEIIKLNKKILSVRTGLRSTGQRVY